MALIFELSHRVRPRETALKQYYLPSPFCAASDTLSRSIHK